MIGRIKNSNHRQMIEMLIGLIFIGFIISLWHHYEVFAPVYESSRFLNITISLCNSGFLDSSLPFILPITGCGFMLLTGHDLEWVVYLNGMFYIGATFVVIYLIMEKLQAPFKLLLSLAFILNASLFLQGFIFEHESVWHFAFFLGVYFLIDEKYSFTNLMGYAIALALALESRGAETILLFPLLCMAFPLKKWSASPLKILAFFCIPWIIPATQILLSLHQEELFFRTDIPLLRSVPLLQGVLLATLFAWIRLQNAPRILYFHAVTVTMVTFWVFERFPDLLYWYVGHFDSPRQLGFFSASLPHSSSSQFFAHEVLIRMMGPTLVPCFIALLLSLNKPPRDRLLRATLLCSPLLLSYLIVIFWHEYSPHYFAGPGFVALIALLYYAVPTSWQIWQKIILVAVSIAIILFELGVLAAKSFMYRPLSNTPLASRNWSPSPPMIRGTDDPIYLRHKDIPTDWYHETDVIAFRFLGERLIDDDAELVTAAIFASNMYSKKPFRRLVDHDRAIDREIDIDALVISNWQILVSQDVNKLYTKELEDYINTNGFQVHTVVPEQMISDGRVIPKMVIVRKKN